VPSIGQVLVLARHKSFFFKKKREKGFDVDGNFFFYKPAALPPLFLNIHMNVERGLD
jgi:hypothetical protein